ncbi:MAG TPA: hypothetical protein VHP37_19685 [Burkholderiales bacterium]|nr:hypothetical protein [Burkholderiales bacterium]
MTFRDRRVPPLPPRDPTRHTPRIRIDLRRGLPVAARYAVAIVIVVTVSLAAWYVGRDEPTPRWIGEGLVPALGWIYLALLAIAAVHWIRQLRAKRARRKEPTT